MRVGAAPAWFADGMFRTNSLPFLFALVLCGALPVRLHAEPGEPILLWSGVAPGEKGDIPAELVKIVPAQQYMFVGVRIRKRYLRGCHLVDAQGCADLSDDICGGLLL